MQVKPCTVQISKESDNHSDDQLKSYETSSPFLSPGPAEDKEGRTTHLEKRLDKMLHDMQVYVYYDCDYVHFG